MSHVGGHKYVGIMMIYPPGDHYGYVDQNNAIEILKTHVLDRSVVPQHWCGWMGVDLRPMQAVNKLPRTQHVLVWANPNGGNTTSSKGES